MPKIKPIKRRDLIKYLTKYGFTGPYSGGSHQFMVKDGLVLRIPNPHPSDIGPKFLKELLKQARISTKDWESL